MHVKENSIMSVSAAVTTINGIAGNIATPDLPTLHFSLLVHVVTGKVTGQAEITMAAGSPNPVQISNITGQVDKLSSKSGPVTQLVVLKGSYGIPGPPPTDYIVEAPFEAHFATDSQWNGTGSYQYGTHRMEGVPVKNEARPPIVPLYGVVIHDAAASGDLARMNAVAAAAQAHIDATDGVKAALTALQAEIKKKAG
jgi:hypothetical protein